MGHGHKEQLVVAASWEDVAPYAAIPSTAAKAPSAPSLTSAKMVLALSPAGILPVLSHEDPSSHSSTVVWDEGSTGSGDIGSPLTSSISSGRRRGGNCKGSAGGCAQQFPGPAAGLERPAGLDTELLQLHERFKSEAWGDADELEAFKVLQQQMQPLQNPLGSSAPQMEQLELLAARAAASGLGPVSTATNTQLSQPFAAQVFGEATLNLVQGVVRETSPAAAAAAAAAVRIGSCLGASLLQSGSVQTSVFGLRLQQQYMHQDVQQQQQQYISQEGEQQQQFYMHREGQQWQNTEQEGQQQQQPMYMGKEGQQQQYMHQDRQQQQQQHYMRQQSTAGPATDTPVGPCSGQPPAVAFERETPHGHCSRPEGGHMLPPAAKRPRCLPPRAPSAPAAPNGASSLSAQTGGGAGLKMASQVMGGSVAQLAVPPSLTAPPPLQAAAAGAGAGLATVLADASAWQSGPLLSRCQIGVAGAGGEPAERTAMRSQLRTMSDDQLWGVAASVIAECKRLGPPGCCC